MPCPPQDGLADVLDTLRDEGVATILSLLPEDEAMALGVAQEGPMCEALGITFLSHPILDFGLPEPAKFKTLIEDIAARLERSEQIAVHCKAGIGRSGMVAACTLALLGASPDDAQRIVTKARGVPTPDTAEQGAFIRFFAENVPGQAPRPL